MTEAGRITAIVDGDLAPLAAKLNEAKSQATAAASSIEGDFKKGLGSGLQSSISGITSSMGPMGSAISSVTGSLGLFGTAAAAGVAGAVALGAAAVGTAANWETLMVDISKTTGVEGSGLTELSSTLQDIRTETGATAEEIAGAVSTAGSIGIPADELAAFSQTAIQMGDAFGMSAETASTAMGQIGNVIKPAEMSWTEFANAAGSAVNALADSMATSEEQILTGMTHLGTVMALLKPSEDTIPAWEALVATVQSLGLAGDQAGEAIQDALTYAAKNASSKDLGIDVAGLLGISGEQLQLDLRTNAPEVLQDVARAIAALPLEQQAAAMAMFGSTGSKAIGLLMGDLNKTTGEFDKLGTALGVANTAFAEGTSLSEAYGKSQETYNAAMDRLGASLDVAGQKLGTAFLPYLADGVDLLTSGVDLLIGFGEAASNLFSSDFSGVWGTNKEDMYQEIVDKKRAEEAGEEVGAAVGEGIAGSDDLQKSPGEALSSDTAEAAVEDAGKSAADVYIEEFGSGLDAGMQYLNGKWVSQQGARSTYGGMFGRDTGTTATTLDSGLDLELRYVNDKAGTKASLWIDGQKVSETSAGLSEGKSEGDLVQELLENADIIGAAENNILELSGEKAKAAILEQNLEAQTTIDLAIDWGQIEMAPATDILENVDWSKYSDSSGPLSAVVGSTDWLKSVLENYVAEAGEGGQQAATELVTNFANALASPSMDALGDVQNWYEQIRSTLSNPLDIAALDAQMGQYKNRLVAGIADAGEYCKSESERIGGITSQAFTDGYLSDAERKSITDLIPELELLQSECPKEFGEAGLASQLEFARQAALSDQSSGDLLESYKRIAPAIESEITDEFLDFGKNLKDQMEGIGSDLGEALTDGVVPDVDKIDDALTNIRSLKLYDPEEFEKQGGENALAYLQGLQDAIDSYEAAKAKVIADPDNEAALASLANTRERLQLYLDQNPLEVAETVDTSMFGSAMEDVAGSINLADILADPEEFKETVMDVPDFVKNTFQPALSDEIDTMLEQWDSGYGKAREQTAEFVDGMAKTAKVMPDLFSERQRLLLDKYTAGLIDAKAALQGISAEANNTADAVERINFAQNAPEASYEDVMFYHSYIGPTSGYASWLTEESGRDETQVRQMLINLDTTEAEEALKTLDGEATAKQTKLVDVNSSAAMTEIRKIDEAASEPITKTVYVEYYDEGYESQNDNGNSSSGSSSAKSFASEGYVASPTLAIVGDRPGGEYVVGAARFEAAAAKINSGGQTIVINHSPVINGSGLSKEEIADVLAKNNKNLLKEVADQIKTGKSF